MVDIREVDSNASAIGDEGGFCFIEVLTLFRDHYCQVHCNDAVEARSCVDNDSEIQLMSNTQLLMNTQW